MAAATTIEKELIGWTPYRPGEPSVPEGQWGKDHWSTLAYLECRAVDNDGIIKNANMRCDARRHRPFANIGPLGTLMDGAEHPTRLANGKTKADHDDWDSAFDLADAGYIRLWWTEPVEHVEMFGYAKARVEFTGEGLYLAHALRAHMASGGRMAEFRGVGARA